MKKFKWLSLFLFAAVLFFGSDVIGKLDIDLPITGITAEAATAYTNGYYTYTVDNDGNATITAVDTAISGDVVIPSEIDGYTVVSLEAYAFKNCINITEITIPESITIIRSDAFYRCYNISTLNFNAINCTSVGSSFSYTVDEYDNILSPVLKTINIGSRVENIPAYAFYYCSQANEIVLPESVISIGTRAFYACSKIKSINIPQSVTFIGNYAFGKCTSLESVTIDAANAEVESDSTGGNGCTVFYGCDALKTVTIGANVEAVPSESGSYIDSLFYLNKTIATLNFNAKNCKDSNRFFYGCSNLNEINIGSTVEKLHGDIFEGTAYYEDENNWTVEYLTPAQGFGYKSKALYIDNCLVAVTTALFDFEISDGTRLIADEVFYAETCKSIKIPDSVKFIGEKAFWCCNSIKEINLSANVERIDYLAFGNMRSLEKITVSAANKNYCSDSYGVLFNKDKTELIQYPVGNTRQAYFVPDGVKKVCDYAFCAPLAGSGKGLVYTEGGNLVVIVLSDSVESLGEYILKYNNSLVTFYIGENSRLKSIGAYAFDYCRALENIVLPDSIEYIGDEAFAQCSGLKNGLHIPSGDVAIGNNILDDAYYYVTDYTNNTFKKYLVSICSDDDDCYAKTYANENEYPFTVCDGNHVLNLEELLPEGTEEPTQPDVSDDAMNIRTPSTTTISYGDSIILHADVQNLPVGGYVEWTASNGNFDFDVSSDGTTCKITPAKSGDTTFIATVYDANGNVVSEDTQEMTSKAGFFQKIIAFFKKLFGLTKTYENVFKDII